jgi:RNA polymerase sigma-70 factor (ECF subfamily)
MSERAAFEDATMPHLELVHRIARSFTGDPGEAEDLVQETYLRAFAKFASHRGPNTGAWLTAICINAARSRFRQARRRPVEVRGELPELPDDQPDVVDRVVAAVERDALREALGRLPEPQRLALVLMDIGGLSASETAHALGCPRGTVLARAHRGRRALMQLLAAQRERR